MGPGTWVEIAVLMRGGIPLGNCLNCDVCVGSWELGEKAGYRLKSLLLGKLSEL